MKRAFLNAGRAPLRAVLPWLAAATLAALLTACGGGGTGSDTTAASTPSSPSGSTSPSTTTPSTTTSPSTVTTASTGTPSSTPVATTGNVLPILLDGGTDGSALNAPFVSVTVCEPGTQNCRTIDHILVDTGSVGLRLNATALSGVALPPVNGPAASAYGECAMFASGYTWGGVRTADVRLAGEQASAIPVQVYGDTAPAFSKVPSGCTNTGVPLDPAGSNGILGVGLQTQDCGPTCASSTLSGMYYTCTANGCTSAAAPLSSQVSNPVAMLKTVDNNGVVIVLPDLGVGGAPSLSGSLILGIGSQSNNQVTGYGVYTANSAGNFSTTYGGRTSSSFIDSGSNGIFFADSSIPRCASGFYCPNSALTLSATVTGNNANSRSVSFIVENAGALPANTAVAHLGGSVVLGRSFDWGLPFFFGRTVFVAFQGMNTPAGVGPYWAF